MLRQMLVPVDFSACACQVARHAFNLARAIGGQVTLLHVLEDQESDKAHELLCQLSTLARRPPVCLVVPVSGLFPGGVAAVILDVAAGRRADLIVLGLRGLGLRLPGQTELGQMALGQVATQVLLGAHVPVQVVPCGQAAAPTREGWRSVLERDSLVQRSLVEGNPVQGSAATPGAAP